MPTTTNPVPSTDPSDLLFNAGKLDEVVNGTSNSFTDRLGVARRTVAGMNADFDAQLADAESDLNVYRADAAASAAEALGYLQTIRATSYGAYASDPATDPLGNPPTVGDEYFNTTANLLKRWNGTTWQASDINTANLAAPSGASLVGYMPTGAGSVAATVQAKLRSMQVKTISDMLALPYSTFTQNDHVSVSEYHAGTGIGGGTFYWDATKNKNTHDGGIVIDPTKVFPPDWSTAADADITAWYTATNTGTGCFVRVADEIQSGFWGSLRPALALQAAVNYCYVDSKSRDWLDLTTTHDITGYTIKTPDANWLYPINMRGGRLIKNDAGFMFSRNIAGRQSESIKFHGVLFEVTVPEYPIVYVVDADKSIKQEFYGCRFHKVAAVKTVGYTQSVRVMGNCIAYDAPDAFIKAPSHLDIKITGNSFEASGKPLLWAVDEAGSGVVSVISGVINDNLIEGYTTIQPLHVSSCIGLSICENYTEANVGLVKFIKAPAPGLSYLQGLDVSGNYIGSPRVGADYDIFAETGVTYPNAIIENNVTNRSSAVGIAMTNMVTNSLISSRIISNRNYSSGKVFATGTNISNVIMNSQGSVALSEISAGSGLKIEFTKFFRAGTPLNEYTGASYFLSVVAPLSASTNYRASFTGVLSIIGVWNGSEIVAKVVLKAITAYGVDGSTTGAEGTGFSVKFSSGTNTSPVATSDLTGIIVEFPSLKYNSNLAFCRAKIKPVENTLYNTDYIYPYVA